MRRGWLNSQIDRLPALAFIDSRPLELCQFGRVIGENQAETDFVDGRKYPISSRCCHLGHIYRYEFPFRGLPNDERDRLRGETESLVHNRPPCHPYRRMKPVLQRIGSPCSRSNDSGCLQTHTVGFPARPVGSNICVRIRAVSKDSNFRRTPSGSQAQGIVRK
jgi:hypothetical protein